MKVTHIKVTGCPVDDCDSEEFQTELGPRLLGGPGMVGGRVYECNEMLLLIKCLKCKNVFGVTYKFEPRNDIPEEVWGGCG